MSVQQALGFIQEVRKQEALRDRIEALEDKADLDAVAGIGLDAGYEFTPDDLRTAFKHDWTMRWLHFQAKGTKEES